MTFQTARYASASAAVCARDGAPLAPLSDDALLDVQRDIGEARRALDALASEVAGEIQARAEAVPGPGGIARRMGFKSAKALVAESLGGSGWEAERLAKVGRALATADAVEALGSETGEAPRGWALVAAALRADEITVEKADILIETLEKLRGDSEVESQFVGLARRLRPHDLRQACAREVVFNNPAEAEERERQLYEDRRLTLAERLDGAVVVRGLLDPLSAAGILTWLDAQTRAAFQAKRATPGDERTPAQMRVDALAMLAHHALKCGAPGSGVATTLVVRIDEESLRARLGVGTCDSLKAPISASTARAMAVDAGILPAVMGGASLPTDVGRTCRSATQAQRIALGERDGGCAWCHAPTSYCDVHHIIHWLFGGKTNMDNLVMLCVSCHHRIHFGGWLIEVKRGEVWFTPPAAIDPARTPRKGGLAHLALSP
ncbi:DUF222 domain-containing protein [Demequina sp.]|uniref:HNH endonuclease signature motif containing protein n=1 Tax=Demequina sp. TaxID=2050685 RepID=UPI003D122116